MTDIDYIKENLSYKARLLQLVEECSECAEAATKLYRVLEGENPTPVNREEAEEHLLEEAADVLNAIDALVSREDKDYCIDFTRKCKLERWRMRVEARKNAE